MLLSLDSAFKKNIQLQAKRYDVALFRDTEGRWYYEAPRLSDRLGNID